MRGRLLAVVGIVGLALAASAWAEDAASFPSGGIADALKARVGKPVALTLDSGTQIGGTVADVRDHVVVLKGVTGREMSDAMVRLDDVSVVEMRVRER